MGVVIGYLFPICVIFLIATCGLPFCRFVLGYSLAKSIKALGGFTVYVLCAGMLIAFGQESKTWMIVSAIAALIAMTVTIVLAKWAKTKPWPMRFQLKGEEMNYYGEDNSQPARVRSK